MTPTLDVASSTGDALPIHYDVFPGARPILLVHGFASNSVLSWADTRWLRAIAATGRGAITADLRGHGRSSKPHEPDDYSPVLLARDLFAVLDATGVETIDIVGYSMGCRVALALTQIAPDRVRRLVLGGIGTKKSFAGWDLPQVERFLLEGTPVDDELVQSTLTIAMSVSGNDPRALLACARGMAAPPVEGPATVPTLVVAGERDRVADDAAALAEKIGASFSSVPNRHHFTAVSSRVFQQGALEFLA